MQGGLVNPISADLSLRSAEILKTSKPEYVYLAASAQNPQALKAITHVYPSLWLFAQKVFQKAQYLFTLSYSFSVSAQISHQGSYVCRLCTRSS
jgi:hypothetical protein